MRKQTGITLVALVITIAIMLIIIGVTVTSLMGSEDVVEKTDVTKIAVELKNIQQQVETKIANLIYERENVDKYQTLESLGIVEKDYAPYIIIKEGNMCIKSSAKEKVKEAAQIANIEIVSE